MIRGAFIDDAGKNRTIDEPIEIPAWLNWIFRAISVFVALLGVGAIVVSFGIALSGCGGEDPAGPVSVEIIPVTYRADSDCDWIRVEYLFANRLESDTVAAPWSVSFTSRADYPLALTIEAADCIVSGSIIRDGEEVARRAGLGRIELRHSN